MYVLTSARAPRHGYGAKGSAYEFRDATYALEQSLVRPGQVYEAAPPYDSTGLAYEPDAYEALDGPGAVGVGTQCGLVVHGREPFLQEGSDLRFGHP